MPQRKRVGRASVAGTGRYVGQGRRPAVALAQSPIEFDLAVAEHLPPIFLRIARRFAAGFLPVSTACASEKKQLGRPKVSPKVEVAIREHLGVGHGILKVAALVGVGSGTVQRVKKEMAGQPAGMPQCWVHPEPKYGAACLYPPIAREGRGTNINSCTTRCRPAPTCRP